MNKIPSFYEGEHLTVRRMQDLADAVNQLLGLQGDGLIQVHGNRLTLNVDGLLARIPKSAGTQVFMAKAQAAASASTALSCKLLDDAGAETGDAFNVYLLNGAVWNKAFPSLINEAHRKLFVVKFGSTWYGISPFGIPQF